MSLISVRSGRAMRAELPESCGMEISPALAADLLRAAEGLPRYGNKEFYDVALQRELLGAIRGECADGFDWLIESATERLSRQPYCVHIRGLRFDEGNRLFVAFNRAFGELVAPPYKEPRAQLVHYVQPETDLRSVRGGSESERMHTDTTDWEEPIELLSMVCVRADRSGGGRTRLLDIDTARRDVEDRLGSEAVEVLKTQLVPWQLADYRGGGLKWRAVLTETRMCWRRYTIDLALGAGQATIAGEILRCLDAFENVIEATDGVYEFSMREGELLLSDNSRTLHARTPIAAPEGSDRLMIRSWIRTC